jgi:benzoyl-CoA reductase/2-hydroxyglutaryl-CoA dehydratase subunit BcrC/BadD/HgdB
MVKFDPNNELSDKELDALAEKNFDEFLDYLDQKAEHLKKFTKPLGPYHLKRYAEQSKKDSTGESLTIDEIKKLQKLGEENTKMTDEELEKHLEWKEKEYEMLRKAFGMKNVKTHRSQWFD